MAGTIVVTYFDPGRALTLDLFAFGSDTRANGSGRHDHRCHEPQRAESARPTALRF